MSGKATIANDSIKFGPLAATNMACTPAAMGQETRFFAALQVRAWRIHPTQQKLVLLDEGSNRLIMFTRL